MMQTDEKGISVDAKALEPDPLDWHPTGIQMASIGNITSMGYHHVLILMGSLMGTLFADP
ncbi:MAG: hypothetical protein AAGA75_12505 [Cyanobacteria bacterium P01_E01_bin.6]